MKKFWKTVEIKEFENNTFQLLLDKNLLKTPLQNELIFINYNSAYETSLEWDVDEDSSTIKSVTLIFSEEDNWDE